MTDYFEIKATYDKVLANGAVKRVTEPYLFQALSFTEAECRAIEELTPHIHGDFSVKACRRTRIAEIFNIGAERYYLVKVGFITINEKTGTETRTISQIIVGATDFMNALEEFNNGMRGTLADFEIIALCETPIVEVYPIQLT